MNTFEMYWRSIGRPTLEVLHQGKWCIYKGPPSLDLQYRILNDPNWDVRKEWIDSDFELPLEVSYNESDWVPAPYMLPTKCKDTLYRVRV